MIVFAVVVLGLLGYPTYIYFNSVLSGGIERAGNYLKVDLKSLGNYPFPANDGKLDEVPAKWRALDGKKVLLMGEVWAPNEAGDHMTHFELVYSIAKCCFGGPPKVQERVFAHVPDNMHVSNLTYSFANVYGTLHVDVKSDHGVVTSVYNLQVQKIEPLQ
jgi:hypothetical protein